MSASASSTLNPLAGLRIAVTRPPGAWFGGCDLEYAVDMMRALRGAGATLFEVDVERFSARDGEYIAAVAEELRDFRPDVALSLPNAGYVTACIDSDRRNLFRDLLAIPTVMLWDHGLFQFYGHLIEPLAAPDDPAADAIDIFKRELDHPLFLHYAPDRGHAAMARSVGAIETRPIQCFVQPSYPVYTRWGKPERNPAGPPVIFTGNVYIEASRKLDYRGNPTLARIESGMLAAGKENVCASAWELLIRQIELAGDASGELRLSPRHRFFWRFVRDQILTVASTDIRLSMLTSLRTPCDFYGNLVESGMGPVLEQEYGIRFRGAVDASALPELYRHSPILVDVVHSCYISGSSPKLTSCMAAGSLPLFNHKSDFRDAFGDLAGHVMYRSFDHLNAMIDDYLAHPRRRYEIACELQQRVRDEFTFLHLARRVLVDQPLWRS